MTLEQHLKSSNGTFDAVINGNQSEAHEITMAQMRRLLPGGYTAAAIVLTFISVFGVFNNFWIFVVIAKHRPLRTPVNLMLMSLSFGDFVIAGFGTPLTAGAAFAGNWIYGSNLCVAYGFAMALAGIASIVTLAVISVERYMLICHPGAVVITTRKTILVILFVWVYAFAVTFPPVLGWSSIVPESPNIACAVNWESSASLDLSYQIYLLILGLVIPLGAIVGSYGKILHFIRHQAQSGAGQGVAKSQTHLIRMVVIMIACFLIAWMPYTLVSLITMAGRKDILTATATAVPAIFAKSSIVYNPIIYALMNVQLRTAFLTMVTCGTVSPAVLHPVNRPKALPAGFSNLQSGPSSAGHKSDSAVYPGPDSTAMGEQLVALPSSAV